MIQDMINAFNDLFKVVFDPWISCLDESMVVFMNENLMLTMWLIEIVIVLGYLSGNFTDL